MGPIEVFLEILKWWISVLSNLAVAPVVLPVFAVIDVGLRLHRWRTGRAV